MCGIFVSICRNDAGDLPDKEFLIYKIHKRGPDHQSSLEIKVNNFTIQFTSSVLYIRGDRPTNQPVSLTDGSVFMFNGEIFNISPNLGFQIDPNTSDTQVIADILEKRRDAFPHFLSSLNGPYAFVFYDKTSHNLWYGRDIIGRRSLCRHVSSDANHLILSSVSPSPNQWEEVTTEGIHCLHLNQDDLLSSSCIEWSHSVSGKENTDSPATIQTCIEKHLNSVKTMQEASEQLGRILSESILRRVTLRRPQVKIGILFSGGLDSSVIALLAHQNLPAGETVDLVNVAFTSDAPDRQTAISAYEKLSSLCSERSFRLIQVNPTREDLTLLRSREIKYLIYPLQTVLDDSVGCALWFASRACGHLYPSNSPYSSDATILLHGLGADELMAGYTRHRRVYDTSNKNLKILQDELDMDIDRLHSRNLGRDDRIVSDHGKEVRFPFLDEQVIAFLNSIPIDLKCNLDEPRGFGEKKLLRCLAMSLGLGEICETQKRAMQFGSRIAKLEQAKESASNHCSRLNL